MGKLEFRFVAKAEAKQGWRIWDRKQGKWWGERYQHYPEQLLDELNDGKRPSAINELLRKTKKRRPG